MDGSVNQSVRIQRGVALVGGGDITPPARRHCPVPHRDHQVALDARGTGWDLLGVCTLGDPIGPVRVRLALRSHRLEVGGHAGPRRSHRHVVIPLLKAGFVGSKILRNFACRHIAYLMA